MPDLDLPELLTRGKVLARVDDTDYVAVSLVVACPLAGDAAPYCLLDDWQKSHVARIAILERVVAEQAGRIAELESTVRDPPPLSCPECGKGGWKSAQALKMHQQRVHRRMDHGPPRIALAPQAFEPIWHCANPACAGVHTRSIGDPRYCIACARAAEVAA